MSLWLAQGGVLTPPSGGGGGLTVSKIAHATGTTSITWPGGLASGDVAVCWNHIWAGDPGEVVPSGFTKLSGAVYGGRYVMSYKKLTGSESGTLLGMSEYDDGFNTWYPNMIVVIFRGSTEIATVTPSTWNGEITSGNPSSQTVTASGGTPPLIVVAGYAASGAVSPASFSPTEDGSVSSTGACLLKWKIYNESPADVTVDMDDEGSSNALSSGYLAVAS